MTIPPPQTTGAPDVLLMALSAAVLCAVERALSVGCGDDAGAETSRRRLQGLGDVLAGMACPGASPLADICRHADAVVGWSTECFPDRVAGPLLDRMRNHAVDALHAAVEDPGDPGAHLTARAHAAAASVLVRLVLDDTLERPGGGRESLARVGVARNLERIAAGAALLAGGRAERLAGRI